MAEPIVIKLTRGYEMIVDPEDSDLTQYKWCSVVRPNGRVYAKRRHNKIELRLSRVILSRILGRDITPAEFCDHINGNTLDNRRSNLRLATCAENSRNSRIRVDNKSGYKGVQWNNRLSKWQSKIKVNGVRKILGSFDDPHLAYEAYCKAALELHGEFARLE